MITAAFNALGDLLSRDFRSVLFKAIGLTLALFIAILIGVEVLLSYLMLVPWPWAETLAAIGAGLVLLVAFFFMMAPVTAIFAGLFLDDIAGRVEARHYARDPAGAAFRLSRGADLVAVCPDHSSGQYRGAAARLHRHRRARADRRQRLSAVAANFSR